MSEIGERAKSPFMFNINDYVNVKLTPFGLSVLQRHHEELRKVGPSVGKFKPPAIDEKGSRKRHEMDKGNAYRIRLLLDAEQ